MFPESRKINPCLDYDGIEFSERIGICSGGGGSSSAPATQTVTQTTTPPAYQVGEQQALNQQATALAAQPYPTYQGQLIAGLTDQQLQGMQQAQTASTAQDPYLQQGSSLLNSGANLTNTGASIAGQGAQYAGAGANLVGQGANLTNQAAGNQWNAQTAQQYMSPYAQAALAPQIQALGIQQGQNSNNINAQATQAGAFGDTQQGNAQALNNFYAGQNLNNLEASGMNTAYTTGQNAFNTANQNLLTAGGQLNSAGGTMGNLGSQIGGIGTDIGNMGNTMGTLAGQAGNLGSTASQTGIAGATANFNAGTQQQALNQSQLTEAYQNFLNQAQWPEQMLNLQNSMLQAGNQYTVPTQNLAPTSSTAQNVGMFSSLAGGIGSLLNGTGGSSTTSSDRRLKKNIKKIGEIKIGIPLYEFDYIWAKEGDIKNLGVMAQDVLEVMPEAVAIDSAGYMSVKYDAIAGAQI